MSNLVLGNPYTPVQCTTEEQQSHRQPRSKMNLLVHFWAASLPYKLVTVWNQRHPCRF
ncbi:hypothetical protein TREVI0001_1487 [Treponema vincentii ATCC 35580]|uniref:Uncharacterized protein n=1 Tax=Treponema vincentii ATCC 35580 TaxID=596324 RepID=C8PMY4_9SPIR|nr:hypothetical protein TREVI0001_1487 [Treponema vincentii ATCC 35580]